MIGWDVVLVEVVEEDLFVDGDGWFVIFIGIVFVMIW